MTDSMWTVISFNDSTSDEVFIDDLGIGIPASSSVTLSDLFEYEDIAGSDDLRNYVLNSELRINDGEEDLDPQSAVEYLTISNIEHLKDEFLTSSDEHYTELTYSGILVTKEEIWEDDSKTKKIRESNISRTGFFVTQIVEDFYEDNGVDILYTITTTYTRDGSNKVIEINKEKN